MIILGLFLLFLTGLSILNAISIKFELLEKIGLSFLVGFAYFGFIMLPIDLLGVKINIASLSIAGILVIIISNIKNYKYLLTGFSIDKDEVFKYSFNLTWVLCFGVLIYLFYGISAKAFYWPTLEYDSVTGYDLMAKAIAHDGKLNNSLFEYIRNSREYNRVLYPPFTACTFAYGYIFGLKTAKLITLLHFGAFLIVFYAFLSKLVSKTGAMLFTLGMMVTPEYFSHAAMALSNLPNAVNTGVGMIALYFWIVNRDKKYFYISLIMIAINNFTRTDAIVFTLSASALLFFDAIKNKTWLELGIFFPITIMPFIAWNKYITSVLHAESSSDYIIKHLFYDSEKISKMLEYINTYIVKGLDLFGLTFVFLLIMILINIKNWNQKAFIFLGVSLLSWFLYTLIYYQMDNVRFDSLEFVMKVSYKRGLFCFVPLAWFFIATNKVSVFVFDKIEDILYK